MRIPRQHSYGTTAVGSSTQGPLRPRIETRAKEALADDGFYICVSKGGGGGVGPWGGGRLGLLLYAGHYLLRFVYVCAFRASTSDLVEYALPKWALGSRVEFVFRDWGAEDLENPICT